MNNFTEEWRQLQADAMALLESFGEKIIKMRRGSRSIVCIRNHEEGYTKAFRICSFSGLGVYYFEPEGERKFVKWSNVREWDLYNFIEEFLSEKAVSIRKRYESLCDITRELFEKNIEDNGEGYYDGELQLRFVIEGRFMKLRRTGSWGVMLEDMNGELYEDDFTGLDMESRCKLVEFLAA